MLHVIEESTRRCIQSERKINVNLVENISLFRVDLGSISRLKMGLKK